MLNIAKPIWDYRGFIFGSVKRDFQLKYRNSVMGALWNVANPLAQITVFTLIFSNLMRAKIEGVDGAYGYSIYLCAGQLTWSLFVEIATRGQTMFIENGNLIKKLSFPKICLPVIVVSNALVNFAIIFLIFTIFLIITGNFPGITFFGMLPLIVILISFSAFLGIILGVLNVFFRDVGHFFGIVLTFWFWLTPIVYPLSALPAEVRKFVEFNPMTGFVAACQSILVFGEWPDWSNLGLLLIITALLAFSAYRLFEAKHGEMVDEL